MDQDTSAIGLTQDQMRQMPTLARPRSVKAFDSLTPKVFFLAADCALKAFVAFDP